MNELEERLATQAELIESLEAELKIAKAGRRAADGEQAEGDESAELRGLLEKKDAVIAELEKDLEDQSRKISKLRGSENETTRLKSLAENDKVEIEKLKGEITQLREQLAAGSPQSGADAGGLTGKLGQHEQAIDELKNTIDEKDARIAELAETAREWKRKYEFLAAEEPEAYKPAAHE